MRSEPTEDRVRTDWRGIARRLFSLAGDWISLAGTLIAGAAATIAVVALWLALFLGPIVLAVWAVRWALNN